jgi:hypothetical protein
VIATRIRAAAGDPRGTLYRLRGGYARDGLFARYGRLARRAGLDRVWFVLSFDCDTPRDAEVAWEVHERLAAMGVTPVYAVPGDLLREAADVYTRIAQTGAEFINHGDRMHAVFDETAGRWASTFFYEQQPREVVRADILDGDRTVQEVIGRKPLGFRTPHFGTFQAPEQLQWLHGVLGELAYRFSSSSVPLWGFRHGPAFDRFGQLELPVTGGAEAPLSILDTWSCFEAHDRMRTAADYEREAAGVAEAYARAGAGILNLYGDPSHIHGRDEFFRAVASWLEVAKPTSYGELLRTLR